MPYNKLEVVLVNLISYDYLVRYQAPLPVNILAGYLRKNIPNIEVRVIDMQDIFSSKVIDGSGKKTIFKETIKDTVKSILQANDQGSKIVGLSMKWTTQDVACDIIRQIRTSSNGNDTLFVLGNILSTYGHSHLLKHPGFKDVLAIIGEGEDALVNIAKVALGSIDQLSDIKLYMDIPNVALNFNSKVNVSKPKRVNLLKYPLLTVPLASDLFDKEWGVYALETSRGCPWGKCTFCAIKGQFGTCNNLGNGSDWKWQAFSLDKVFIDISTYISQGARNFDIKDSEFFGPMGEEDGYDHFWDSMDRIEEFAHRFAKLNKKFGAIINHISVRVDTVFKAKEPLKNVRRLQIYDLLKKSGLLGLYLGIESGSPNQLRRYGKGVTVEENKEVIRILRKLGFEIEIGFIFFSPLDNVEDLHNNINFIEETKLYETDSRIFGSLRAQEGTNYVKMLRKKDLLGKFYPESLNYGYRYQDDKVYFIKKTFDSWEASTIKLVRLLPLEARLTSYEMNFFFLRDILNAYNNGLGNIEDIVTKHVKKRNDFLNNMNDTGGLLAEYLRYAKTTNNALLG